MVKKNVFHTHNTTWYGQKVFLAHNTEYKAHYLNCETQNILIYKKILIKSRDRIKIPPKKKINWNESKKNRLDTESIQQLKCSPNYKDKVRQWALFYHFLFVI